MPPALAVPYRVLSDKINSADGLAPSLPPLKLYGVVKPEPSVLIAKTTPQLELPPYFAVPYKVLPDKINPAKGLAPSLLVAFDPKTEVKEWSAVKVCAGNSPGSVKVISAVRRKKIPRV